MRADAIVVSGWSATSPYGLGGGPFTEGLRAGRGPIVPVSAHGGPYGRGAVVPDFEVATVLGRKGTRAMDRVTALTIATVRDLVPERGVDEPEHTALVLGGSAGSYQSIVDFTASSMTGDRPYLVDPARFPNTVMNKAAGQTAIWYGLKGPNATISGGRLTGLLALSYSTRLHRRGRAGMVLCGAVEEFTEQRCWIDWHAAGRPAVDTARPPGEGCAIFVMESAASAREHGRAPLAEVLGTGFAAFHDPAEVRKTLAGCVRSAVDRLGVEAAAIRVIAPNGDAGPLGVAERAAVGDVLGDGPRELVRVGELLGDTSAASAAFQLAGVLATPADGLALITSVDPGGTVGCALVRLVNN